MQGIRKIIAKRMTDSFQNIPHFYLSVEVDMSAVQDLKERVKDEVEKRAKVRLTLTDILVKVVASALKEGLSEGEWGGRRCVADLAPDNPLRESIARDAARMPLELKVADAAGRAQTTQVADAGQATLNFTAKPGTQGADPVSDWAQNIDKAMQMAGARMNASPDADNTLPSGAAAISGGWFSDVMLDSLKKYQEGAKLAEVAPRDNNRPAIR